MDNNENSVDRLTALHNKLQMQEKALKKLEEKASSTNETIDSPINENIENQNTQSTYLQTTDELPGQRIVNITDNRFDIVTDAQNASSIESEKKLNNLCEVRIDVSSRNLESGFRSFDLSFLYDGKEILLQTAGRSENFPEIFKEFSFQYLQAVLQDFVEKNTQEEQTYENLSKIINESIDEIVDKVKQLLEFHTRENASYRYVDYVQPNIESMLDIQADFNRNIPQTSEYVGLKNIDLLRSIISPDSRMPNEYRAGYEGLLEIMSSEESNEEVGSRTVEKINLNMQEILDILETKNITIAEILKEMDQHPASLVRGVTYSDKFPIKKYPVKGVTESKTHTDKGFSIIFQRTIHKLLNLDSNTKLTIRNLSDILNNKYNEQNNIQVQKIGATYNNVEEIMKLHDNGSSSNSFGGFGGGKSRTGNNPKIMGTRWKGGMSSKK